MLQKLQIYFQPVQHSEHLESLTISYDDFDETSNTFKQKIVLERDGAKYKIKRWLGALGSIKPFLESLDISKYKFTDVNLGDAYYYVKYGEQFLATSNADDIRELLDWVNFDEIQGYGLEEYQKCN